MVDLFLEPPMPFAQLWSRAVTMKLRGVPIRVSSIDNLITIKSPMSDDSPEPGRLSPQREALLRTTLALSIDERVAWLEQMMAIAMDSGALPKRVPDQVAEQDPNEAGSHKHTMPLAK
jgi:hypothetical protein